MKPKKAIYAFSGDPITYGHIDIIQRAAKIFDEVIVAVGVNPAKKYLFTLKEREELAIRSLVEIKNVKVISFRGLLVDHAFENDIPVIIKGLRNHEDFGFEMVLHHVGESQKLGIDTFFIPSRQELQHISSGAVKAIQLEQGTLTEYVPMVVKQKLEERLSEQFFCGVINVTDKTLEMITRRIEHMPVHIINIDALKDEIKNHVSDETIHDQSLIVKIRKAVYGKRGLILLKMNENLADKISYLCNNNLIYLNDTSSGLSFINTLKKKIKNDSNGKLLILEKDDPKHAEKIQSLLEETFTVFKEVVTSLK